MVRRSSRSATVPSWVALACGVATLLAAGAGLHRAPTLISPAVAAPAEATPNCPGQTGLDAPDADPRCSTVMIHGNIYRDVNENGIWDPYHGPETRLPGITVRLSDAATGMPLGQAASNGEGYYRFALLAPGPTYRVEVVLPAGYRATGRAARDLQTTDFSRYWCCSVRVDFGLVPGQSTPVPPTVMPPPFGPSGTPIAPPCCERPYGRQVHLPILNYEANDNVCSSVIEAQNVGAWPSKALLVVWGAPGACPPQCAGPLKVECSGLLKPGSAWHFMGAQLPRTAKSGMVFSAPALQVPGMSGQTSDIFADRLCEALFANVVGNCNEYRRFKKAFNESAVWWVGTTAFDFATYPGASMAVEVVRKCPGDIDPMVSVTGGYDGLADDMLGAYDPVYGGYAFFAPLVYADRDGFDSWLYIQNGGLECSSLEIWFKAQDDCMRPRICDVLTLAPGETHQFDASSCVGAGWIGSAWVRGSEPLSVVVDTIGRDLLTSYHGHPSEIKYTFDGAPQFTTGSQVAYGPLLYSEYQGWDSLVQVQNLSQVTNAKVKVYFLDRGGNVVTTLVDWICPGGSQGFYLPVVAQMPGNWVGGVRVESQDWFSPGQPQVPAPSVVAVAQLIKYADVARLQPLEAVAYDLLPEQRAYDWQVGSGWGGLFSGVGRIGIPSFMKDVGGSGLTTELAIANLVPKPGFTDFAIYIYDQNGLVQNLCEKLNERQVEYLDVDANLAFLPSGFKGSAVISAVFWEHDVFDANGYFMRNLVGLAAIKIERTGTVQGADVPGDESAASEGFPIIGAFDFAGPPVTCPGVPGGASPLPAPTGTPWAPAPTAPPFAPTPTLPPPPPPPAPQP